VAGSGGALGCATMELCVPEVFGAQYARVAKDAMDPCKNYDVGNVAVAACGPCGNCMVADKGTCDIDVTVYPDGTCKPPQGQSVSGVGCQSVSVTPNTTNYAKAKVT